MDFRKYSTPVIKKGKEITSVPKGSSKAIEQAKQTWYIEYTFNGKQIRTKRGLNRIKDHIEKQYEADVLLQSIKNDLANGFDPLNPVAYIEQSRKEYTTFNESLSIFKEYHTKHHSRKKTISTYMSKLKALDEFYPGKLLKDFTTRDIERFILSKISDTTYSHNSVKSAKRIISTFFNVMIKENYTNHNPMQGFDKKIKSTKEIEDKHLPYSDADLKKIFGYLDINDKFTAFFCRMIYYTCMRPSEIRGLKLKDINMNNHTITIRASIKKTTTDNQNQIISIDKNLLYELESLNINQYPDDYYLIGSISDIVGKEKVGENTPYNKLMKALDNIDKNAMELNPNIEDGDKLLNKGYDLYSFKHTSNIKKYNAGWTLTQIMKANRHGSISMTEIYLKKLGSFTDTKHLEIPAI